MTWLLFYIIPKEYEILYEKNKKQVFFNWKLLATLELKRRGIITYMRSSPRRQNFALHAEVWILFQFFKNDPW